MLPEVTDRQLAVIPKYTLRVTLQFVATCVPLVEKVEDGKQHMSMALFARSRHKTPELRFVRELSLSAQGKYTEKLMARLIQLNIRACA